MTRKAQVKIQEMSFMLLAIIFFFILAGLFYIVITSGDIKRGAEQSAKEEAIFLISRAAEGPELSYGKSLSVDADKLVVLKNRLAYQNFWPVDSLVVRKAYPAVAGEIECGGGNYHNCNTFTIVGSSSTCWTTLFSSFVAICRKEIKQNYEYDICEIGKIEACPKQLR